MVAPTPPEGNDLTNAVDEDGLTRLKRAFCDRYMELLGSDEPHIKKLAAIQAGYSESNAASAAYWNLRHPACVAYIGRHLQAAAAKVGVDRSYVLFKAVLAVEMAENRGNISGMNKALELVAKHVDVAAFTRDPEGGAGGFLGGDLSSLSREQLLALADILATLGGRPASAPDA